MPRPAKMPAGRTPLACTRCRHLKVKCIVTSYDSACLKCQRENRDCAYLPVSEQRDIDHRPRRRSVRAGDSPRMDTRPTSGSDARYTSASLALIQPYAYGWDPHCHYEQNHHHDVQHTPSGHSWPQCPAFNQAYAKYPPPYSSHSTQFLSDDPPMYERQYDATPHLQANQWADSPQFLQGDHTAIAIAHAEYYHGKHSKMLSSDFGVGYCGSVCWDGSTDLDVNYVDSPSPSDIKFEYE
jgi:hypothetical protein